MMEHKRHLRRRLLARRAALPAAVIERHSAAITTHVCAIPGFQASRVVMVYLPLPQEVQTEGIVAAARRLHKRLAVPVMRGQTLVAVELPSEAARLRRGPYGILEPDDTAVRVPPEALDLVIVPGVAFDPHGGRLGFGKGFYDRFLRQLPPTACYYGLAFAMQIVPRVPRMSHDVDMHRVITETGVFPEGGLPAGLSRPTESLDLA